MGDKNHKAVVLDANGHETARQEVENTPAQIEAFLAHHPGATLVMETGTHCRWVSTLALRLGLKVLVANARKVEAIWKSSRKNDWRDAEMLAKLARTEPSLLHPVRLRGEGDQRLMRTAKSREALVRARTAIVNQVRGFCKAEGVRLRKCSPEAFHALRADVPAAVGDITCHLFDILDALTEGIKTYNRLLAAELQRLRPQDADLILQVPGVGPVTAAVFLAAVGDASTFGNARDAGAYFGLVPRQSQSGGSDPQLRISKEGNAMARRLLVQAANHILGPFGRDSDLRRHGLRIAERGGKNARKRAKVAVARKLAVLLMALLQKRAAYRPLANEAPPADTSASCPGHAHGDLAMNEETFLPR